MSPGSTLLPLNRRQQSEPLKYTIPCSLPSDLFLTAFVQPIIEHDMATRQVSPAKPSHPSVTSLTRTPWEVGRAAASIAV